MSEHDRLRRRALVWSLPVVLLTVVLALRLLSLGAINGSGQSLLDDSSPAEAADRFGWLGSLNPVETWIHPYNVGVARYDDGDFAVAENRFRVALDRAPGGATGCRVRHNLLISIEAQGDDAAEDRRVGDARERWTEALELATDGPCPDRDGEIGDRFAEDEERLRAKLDPNGSGGDDSDDPDPDQPQPSPDSGTQDRLEDLEQQTSDAIEQDRLDDSYDRNEDGPRPSGDRW